MPPHHLVSSQDWAAKLPDHLTEIAALLIPDRTERTCPRAVKRARHNNYRVKKPGEPASIRHTPVMAVCWVGMALVMIMKVLQATCPSRRTMPDVIIAHVHRR